MELRPLDHESEYDYKNRLIVHLQTELVREKSEKEWYAHMYEEKKALSFQLEVHCAALEKKLRENLK